MLQPVLVIVTGERSSVLLDGRKAGFRDDVSDFSGLLDLVEPVLLEDGRMCGDQDCHDGPSQRTCILSGNRVPVNRLRAVNMENMQGTISDVNDEN